MERSNQPDTFELHSKLLENVVLASRILLDAPNNSEGMDRWMQTIGEAIKAWRLAIGDWMHLEAGELAPRVLRLWARNNSDVPPMPQTSDFALWARQLVVGDTIWCSYDQLEDPASKSYWDHTGCRASLLLPVQIAGKPALWVYFGFDDQQLLPDDAVSGLRAAAEFLAASVRRQEAIEAAEKEKLARNSAVLEERSRIGREIHDTIAQGLIGILMHVRAAKDLLDDRERCSGILDLVEQLAEHNLSEARRSVGAMRPTQVSQLGICRAIEQLASEASRESSLEIKVHCDITVDPGFVIEDHLYRIAQEAIRNVIKHARATEIEIRLQTHGSHGNLQISDNGYGFSPEEIDDGRYGLLGIQERAERFNATLTIVSEPGNGTKIIVAWRNLEAK